MAGGWVAMQSMHKYFGGLGLLVGFCLVGLLVGFRGFLLLLLLVCFLLF